MLAIKMSASNASYYNVALANEIGQLYEKIRRQKNSHDLMKPTEIKEA